MSVSAVARRASLPMLRMAERSNSCPDLRRINLKKPLTRSGLSQGGSVRHLNLMLLNPRAPKIRHLNASHSLLIEMEKHVRKVQELEYKVHELEMQLQLKELVKTHTVINQAWEAEKEADKDRQKVTISEEAQKAFALRLTEARRKAELLSIKRAEEEANILRSWHQKKLRLAIDKLSQIPENENEMKMLPEPSMVTEQDLEMNTNLLFGLETLIDFANQPANQTTFNEEVSKLKQLLNERENLKKLIEDIKAKESQTNVTVEDCKNTLFNVNAARIKVNANLKMSKPLLNTMQNLESKRKHHNIFVFGPNPIFNEAKEHELNYSINNKFVIEMLKELDISFLVAEKNLVSAKECRKRYKENKAQIEESLQLVQETIDMQINKVNELQTEQDTQKNCCETKLSEEPKIIQNNETLDPQKNEI
eukprot:GFUD01019306.1.p1 GENE.GFUD01019306.1~~GFUD01019306.1.p1  ORF type:complete len:422 (+),score=134.91 GFUD01019306.1:264-1529(+)